MLKPGQLVLMTIRSHDQFHTTVYGYNDCYRGLHNERRVIFLNAADVAERGLCAEQLVTITGHFEGQQRHAEQFIVVPYDIPESTKFVVVTVAPLEMPAGTRLPTSQQVAVPA